MIIARFIGDPAGYVVERSDIKVSEGFSIPEVLSRVPSTGWAQARRGSDLVHVDLAKAYVLEGLTADGKAEA